MSRPYQTTNSSRERNRIHAQKTRLRKKEQMQVLQAKAAALKEEQVRLKQTINEKNTATILVRLFAEGSSSDAACRDEDPLVEELLRRPLEKIPDATTIPELPALILPGQHASKKMKANMQQQPLDVCSSSDLSLDGIDYELLGRNRSLCTPGELDLIRRERNRMHAKRTRDRKRIFTEKLAELCRELEDDNILLHLHLKKIDPDYEYEPPMSSTSLPSSTQSSPKMQPTARDLVDMPTISWNPSIEPIGKNVIFDEDMISSLLKAAEQELNEISDAASAGDDDLPPPSSKKPRIIPPLSVA